MTLHQSEQEVGVRALHDRLSEYLDGVERGTDVVVTRRGKRVARLTAVDRADPLHDLASRGLIRLPRQPRTQRQADVAAAGPVAELVADQRR